MLELLGEWPHLIVAVLTTEVACIPLETSLCPKFECAPETRTDEELPGFSLMTEHEAEQFSCHSSASPCAVHEKAHKVRGQCGSSLG